MVGQPRAIIGTTTRQGNFCLKCGAWRGELGLEPTIELYIDHLIQIFDEVKQVLKKSGTCWVVIDDSYAGSWGAMSHNLEKKGKRTGYAERPNTSYAQQGVSPKSLCGIPERFVLAMMDRGWIRRNTIAWVKNNSMPESVKDRFTGSWEHLFFFTKSRRYYFEQQFEPHISPLSEIRRQYSNGYKETEYATNKNYSGGVGYGLLGRNKRDVWKINTAPSPAHGEIRNFATFPEKLCETPILAGCPAQICKRCGKARKKVYESSNNKRTRKVGEGQDTEIGTRGRAGEPSMVDKGYTDCGCNAGFEPGVVLDPFAGSGTVMAVAKKLGRKAIGIELNEGYCNLTVKRLQKISLSLGVLIETILSRDSSARSRKEEQEAK